MLYAVTGIVLARELSEEAFGLVGAVLVFQAFASLLVDSGFSYALIQRKRPSRLDYSTVLWFNIGLSLLLYLILFFCAPLIAEWFQNDRRLIPLARVMFLSIILNATAIVQTNRLMKAMDVRMVAASNVIGLTFGSLVGIWMALRGFGAWAIVAQTLIISSGKSLVLWTTSRWRPVARFSIASLRSYFRIGSRMMFTSFLNTVFLNIYSFFIGNRCGMTGLGYYSQSDKWSKMGVTSITQVLTSSFLPALSAVQDDMDRFRNMASKMNRFTSYLVFPALIGLMAMAAPIFHTLFGTKWDPSVGLFQLLLFRGIFVVFNSLYTNYLLALGLAKSIVRLEILRDGAALAALALTFPFIAMELPDDPVYGIRVLLWGQVIATIITWAVTLIIVVRATGSSLLRYALDMLPYFALTSVILPIVLAAGALCPGSISKLATEIAMAIPLYLGANYLLKSKIQHEVITFLTGRFRR
ncbi:MAG: lipopolysaccharide biosynthesis protein [Muribaculaceae bacterium]|nr:lipopolysaccharide biosynthesis protein [Muribaculaceae bacterium]